MAVNVSLVAISLLSGSLAANQSAPAAAERPYVSVPAHPNARPTDTDPRISDFAAKLAASETATAVLQAQCSGGLIVARKVSTDFVEPERQVRARLGVSASEPLGYRRVELVCGDMVFSRAENWFVPARLTPDIRKALDDSNVPFGRAIRALEPKRDQIAMQPLAVSGAQPGATDVLSVTAIVRGADGRALAEVREVYTSAVLAP